MRVITVKIPEAMDDMLSSFCRTTLRTKSFFIREALREFLNEKAVYQKALDRLQNRTDEIITAEEMRNLVK